MCETVCAKPNISEAEEMLNKVSNKISSHLRRRALTAVLRRQPEAVLLVRVEVEPAAREMTVRKDQFLIVSPPMTSNIEGTIRAAAVPFPISK